MLTYDSRSGEKVPSHDRDFKECNPNHPRLFSTLTMQAKLIQPQPSVYFMIIVCKCNKLGHAAFHVWETSNTLQLQCGSGMVMLGESLACGPNEVHML